MNNYLEKIKETISKNKKKLIIGTSIVTFIAVGLGVSTVTFVYNKAKSNTNYTEEQAKEIALKHANLKSDQVRFVRSELDYDDKIQTYDIEFYFNNIEYNYEIDANTGNVLSYEQE